MDFFEQTVADLAKEMFTVTPQLWEWTDDLADWTELFIQFGVKADTARDAAAIVKSYTVTQHNPTRRFTDLLTEIVFRHGWNAQVVEASIVWNLVLVQIPAHIDRHGQAPVDPGAMLDYFASSGDIDLDTVY